MIVQDVGLFVLSGVAAQPIARVLQGIVLLVAIALAALAQRASMRGWIV